MRMPVTMRDISILLGVMTLCLLVGCASDQRLWEDIRASRAKSAARWEESRTRVEPSTERLQGALALDQAVHIAVGNNKQLLAVMEERAKAEGRITEAWSGALPHLSFQQRYTHLRDVPTFSTDQGEISVGDNDNYSYQLNLQQPLFTGGATRAALRAARIYRYLSDEMVKGTVQQVIFQTRKGYFDVLLAQVLVNVADTAVRLARAHLEQVQKRRREGLASNFDVLRAKVELSNEQALEIRQKNRLHLAQVALLKVLGVSQESQVQLVDKLEYLDMKADLGEAVQTALQHRPELIQSELSVRLQEQALKIAKAGWWPKISLFAAYERAKPSPVSMTVNQWENQLSGGLVTEIPIFDGLATLGKVRQEKAELRRQKILLTDTEELVLLEVRQAVLSLADAVEFVQSQKTNLESAQEALRLAEVGYRNEVNTQVEVLDARSASIAAQGLHYQALYEHLVAKLELQKATGMLRPPEIVPESE